MSGEKELRGRGERRRTENFIINNKCLKTLHHYSNSRTIISTTPKQKKERSDKIKKKNVFLDLYNSKNRTFLMCPEQIRHAIRIRNDCSVLSQEKSVQDK